MVITEGYIFRFFGISGWGTDLDYYDTEWFAMEMDRDHAVIFEMAPKYCISNTFVGYRATRFFKIFIYLPLQYCIGFGLYYFYGILAHSSRYNGHLN